jgi:voltage-gated potassium channel
MNARTRLITALLLVLAVFLVGTVGYVLFEGAKLSDAIYMTAITLSTVGYGETVQLDGLGRMWTILVIVFGIGAVGVAFGMVTAMIVSGDIGRMMGSRKLQAQIDQLDQHVIVCGFGRMGSILADDLQHQSIPIVVIENDQVRTRVAEERKMLYVLGDASEEAALRDAGIARARALVTVLPHDSDNVFTTLTARALRSDLYIVARCEQPTSENKLLRAGANRVISPQTIGASRIAAVLTRPNVVDFVDMANRGVDLEMDEFSVVSTSPVAGKTLRQAELRQYAAIMVIAIKHHDGQTVFSPGPDEVLNAGDTLITIGPAGSSSKLKELRLV